MAIATQPSDLPVKHSSFIGREHELDEITGLLGGRAARLVTLTGPGGCGKTRLALSVAERLIAATAFADGVWLVELAGLDISELLDPTVAAALGLAEGRGQPALQTLRDFFQDKAGLLIIDNCEHLLAACTDLARALLNACPRLSILATSREPLGLLLETVWLVPPLALPDPGPAAPLTRVLAAEAVQLFAARAHTALAGFTVTEDNAAAVAQICRQLDGIPLAIELAAARVKMLAVEQIAARLGDGLRLLARGNRESPARHQTMQAALDWGYGLLTPREQRLFGRLAVLAGSFTLEAVESICTDPSPVPESANLSAAEVLDVLSNLVDKSMVLIAEREPGTPVRYRLLEPIRQYALEKLRETGAEAATRDRHLAYFVDFAEQAESKLKTENQLQWLRRLDKEHDNLRAALAWSAQAASRNLAGLRTAKALHRYWYQRGYGHEGRRWLGQAIANYDAQVAGRTPQTERWLARALVADGWLGDVQGDYRSIPAGLERGLALARELDDPVTAAYALGLLGLLSGYRGDSPALTRQYSVDSVESARRSGDPWSLAWAMLHHGLHGYYHWRDMGAARTALDESEALFRQVGDQRWRAVVVNLRAIITANTGEYNAAQALYEEALAIALELGDLELQYKELFNLAGLAVVQGDTARAEKLYTRALEHARGRGARLGIGDSLQGLAQINIMRGDLAAADQLLREGQSCLREVGHDNPFARLLSKLARVSAARGQTARAARALGAIEAYLASTTRFVDVDERVPYEQHLAWVRETMAPEEFEAAFAAGRLLTLDQALQELLAAEPAPSPSAPQQRHATQPLRLYALGPARVRIGEHTPVTWPYAKVKELLFYLVTYSARTKAQIGLALWPEASPTQLRNSLGTTLYHLRRTLGNPEWIVFDDDQYRFNRGLGHHYDVEVFESHLVEAGRLKMQTPAAAVAQLSAGLLLYQGDFVEDCVEGEWFRLRREELWRKYLGALLELGQLLFALGEFARAAEAYRQAIDKDPVGEAAHRELMRCYTRLGERGQALRHYETLKQIMQAELGSPPAPESLALYERLKRGTDV